MRGVVCSVMLLVALPALYVYSREQNGVKLPKNSTVLGRGHLKFSSCNSIAESPNNELVNSVLMAITGFWIGGPANLISSAISADLGEF